MIGALEERVLAPENQILGLGRDRAHAHVDGDPTVSGSLVSVPTVGDPSKNLPAVPLSDLPEQHKLNRVEVDYCQEQQRDGGLSSPAISAMTAKSDVVSEDDRH